MAFNTSQSVPTDPPPNKHIKYIFTNKQTKLKRRFFIGNKNIGYNYNLYQMNTFCQFYSALMFEEAELRYQKFAKKSLSFIGVVNKNMILCFK